MPYWRRLEYLRETLDSFRQYKDIEVIVVNDGDEHPDVDAVVIDLPPKDEPKNPCVPLNVGIERAKGDILAITNPETAHKRPIFDDMMTIVRRRRDLYVQATVWDIEREKWIAHPTRKHHEPVPQGFGLHFCVMMDRERCPLFDEDYREGAGYEDNDFAFRVREAGLTPHWTGGVAYHHHTVTHWKPQGFTRNREIFRRKWL